jgi:hypothetical protein
MFHRKWSRRDVVFAVVSVLLACISGWGTLHAKYALACAGIVGGMVAIFFTGVHGDVNAIGGIVYVAVNTTVYFFIMKGIAGAARRVGRER